MGYKCKNLYFNDAFFQFKILKRQFINKNNILNKKNISNSVCKSCTILKKENKIHFQAFSPKIIQIKKCYILGGITKALFLYWSYIQKTYY